MHSYLILCWDIMKVAFFILALFSLRAAQVAAEDGWHDGLSDSDHKQSPRPDDSQYDERPGQDKSKTQVLWGPCESSWNHVFFFFCSDIYKVVDTITQAKKSVLPALIAAGFPIVKCPFSFGSHILKNEK